MQHNPSFNLFILYNNSFDIDNQGSEINNNIFSKTFLSFTKIFFLLFFLTTKCKFDYLYVFYISIIFEVFKTFNKRFDKAPAFVSFSLICFSLSVHVTCTPSGSIISLIADISTSNSFCLLHCINSIV